MWQGIYNRWTDALRFWGALLFWNLRKTCFALGGRRRRAPCQDRSDADRPGCSRCLAAAHWHDPAAFRRVCPLLQRTADGWRCGVASRDVRPFWGRALAWYGGALLGLFLLGTLGVWGILRVTGVPEVAWRDVAWPPAWHRISEAQARGFFRQSIAAFNRGRLNEAYVALRAARIRDPRFFDAKLLMAQITMFQGSQPFADDLFRELMAEAPAEQERIAVTYHDTLLSLARMPALAGFSLEMVQRDPGHAALWVRSLLLALRKSPPAAELIGTDEALLSLLAPHARLLVEAELALARGEADRAHQLLHTPFAGPLNGVYMTEQLQRLLALGQVEDAQSLLRHYALALGDFEAQVQQYHIDRAAGDDWSARMTFEGLIRRELSAGQVERLLSALLIQPGKELYLKLHQNLKARSGLTPRLNGVALWVTGLVCAAPAEARQWQQLGTQTFGDRFPAIDRVDFTRLNLGEEHSVIHLINVLTLPREVAFTLLAQVELPVPTDTKRALRHREG